MSVGLQGRQCGKDVFETTSEAIQRGTDPGDDAWGFHSQYHIHVASTHCNISIVTMCLVTCALWQVQSLSNKGLWHHGIDVVLHHATPAS